jgi:hypothetical protein
MRKTVAALSVLLVLSACGGLRESRLNPFNWFGQGREARVEASAETVARDPRPLVAEVVSLSVDRMPGGAIVRAMGLPPTQGYWEAELVAAEDSPAGTLAFEFRIAPPPEPRRAGTQRSREVLVGRFLSTARLEGIRTITVIGAENRRSARR